MEPRTLLELQGAETRGREVGESGEGGASTEGAVWSLPGAAAAESFAAQGR